MITAHGIPDLKRGARARALLIGALVLTAVTLDAPGVSGAADRVVVRDTHIGQVLALDGVVVYPRYVGFRPAPSRPWMRIVGGRALVARGMPAAGSGASVQATGIGLDAKRRVVVTVVRTTTASGLVTGRRWFLYDVRADRARPVRLGPIMGDCAALAVWGSGTAYGDCGRAYLRSASQSRALPMPPSGLNWAWDGDPRWVLRGATLVGDLFDDSDGIHLALFADDSGSCMREIPGLGAGDAGDRGSWWLSRRFLTWTMGDSDQRGSPLVGARLAGHCQTPGPAGLLFRPPRTMQVVAVDDRYAYYGTSTRLLRQSLPAEPSTTPPANDDFDHATPLKNRAPLSVTGVIGAATTQPDDPPIPGQTSTDHPRRTVWYVFRPATTQRVAITLSGVTWGLGHFATLAVYTGSGLGALTLVSSGRLAEGVSAEFDATAGETYWILIDSNSVMPDYRPVTLSVRVRRP